MEALIVFGTFPNVETARSIARTLVEEQLAACGNLIPHVESIYRWKGVVETSAEVLVLFKTTRSSYPSFEARLRDLHPYELPEIVAVSPDAGLPDYLKWVVENSGA